MNHIKIQAKHLASRYQTSLFITLLYIGLYSSFRDLFIQIAGVLGIIIAFLAIALDYGKVTAGLKVVNEKSFDPQREAASGLIEFKALFSTYGWITLITFAFFLVGMFALFTVAGPYFLSLLDLIEAEMIYGIQSSLNQMAGGILLIINICLVISELIFNTFFFATPYLAKDKNVYGLKAVKEALKMSKGKRLDVLKLYFHYLLFMVCFICVEYLASYYISSILFVALIEIVLNIVSILLYENEFVVARALLYKELDRKENPYDLVNA